VTELGFRVERVGAHWLWEVLSDDGRRRIATHEERLMWERIADLEDEWAEAIRIGDEARTQRDDWRNRAWDDAAQLGELRERVDALARLAVRAAVQGPKALLEIAGLC
jgi:hypothetical protein